MEGKNVPPQVLNEISGASKTVPLYHDNRYVREFDSRIEKIIDFDDKFYVILDRTSFFPEGGGQPGDAGTLET